MTDPSAFLALSSLGLAGIGLSAAAGLKAWSEWLEVKRLELDVGHGTKRSRPGDEVTALRERVRRLEAIASGVEL